MPPVSQPTRSRSEIISEMVDSGLYSDEEIKSLVQKSSASNTGSVAPVDNRSLMTKGMEALAYPEKKAKEGLNMLAGMVPNPPEPTGNLPLDVAKGTPAILAKSGLETMANVAPSFVSPLSLSMMGAGGIMKGLSKIPAVGRAVGSVAAQGENLAGIEEGTLGKVFKNPKLLFARAKEEAKALYNKAYARYPNRIIDSGAQTPDKIIDTAKTLQEAGALNPAEAKTALKAIKSKMGGGADDVWHALIKKIEPIKNSDPDFAKADELHSIGERLKTLQKILPQNKTGGVSVFKMGEAGLLGMKGGPFGIAAAAQFSPFVQGAEAAAAGALTANPIGVGGAMGAAEPLIKALIKRRNSK